MRLTTRTWYMWFLIALLLTFVAQAAAIRLLPAIDKYDSKEYLAISGNLFKGNGYALSGVSFEGFESFKGETPTRARQPGYPLYLVVFYWLLGQSVLVVQLSQVLLNSLTLWLTFLIARKAFGERLWPGTVVALSLYFPLWVTSAFVLTESLFTFCITLFMFVLQRALCSPAKQRWFGLTGALLGLAFLVRPLALPLVLFSVIPIRLRVGGRRAYLSWGVLVVSFLAVIMPWFLRNALVLGDVTPVSTDGGYALWEVSLPPDTPKWFGSPEFRQAVAHDGYYNTRASAWEFTQMALSHIRDDPWGYLVRGIGRTLYTWSYFPGSQLVRDNAPLFALFTVSQLALLALALAGLLTVDKTRVAYLLLPAVAFFFLLIFTKATSRYLVPAMPFVLLLAGQGLHYFAARLWGRKAA